MNTALAPVFSHLYRRGRTRTIRQVYEQQDRERRPRDLEAVVEIGDQRLKALPAWAYTFPIPPGIGVDFYDLHFPSPLTLAAFKDDLSIIDIWMRLGLGGACIKTVMKDPRTGNKRPRLQEVKAYGFVDCLINAMGLPGHGVEGKIQEFEQSTMLSRGRPIGMSIGGSSVGEYKHVFDRLHTYVQGKNVSYYFEVNVSCPNTPEGQQMTKNPQLLEDLLKYMRERTNAVMGAKFSPDTPDKQLVEFAEMLKRFQRTYMNLGNTTFRKCTGIGLPDDAISIGGGGLSGPPLFGRTLEMTQLIAPTGIAICATGGIDSAEKVKALQKSVRRYGTQLIVGMATAVVNDMYCIPRINRGLAKHL
ncbi:hypothetical protein HYS50_01925 [Candidatus Woesearchaeota archaeon]|nr:hypothetical protein [Candidatus Woesearchaeota archaeon]